MYNWKHATAKFIKWCFNGVNSDFFGELCSNFGQSLSLELIALIKYVIWTLASHMSHSTRTYEIIYRDSIKSEHMQWNPGECTECLLRYLKWKQCGKKCNHLDCNRIGGLLCYINI